MASKTHWANGLIICVTGFNNKFKESAKSAIVDAGGRYVRRCVNTSNVQRNKACGMLRRLYASVLRFLGVVSVHDKVRGKSLTMCLWCAAIPRLYHAE